MAGSIFIGWRGVGGNPGTITDDFYTSPDGITWTGRNLLPLDALPDLTPGVDYRRRLSAVIQRGDKLWAVWSSLVHTGVASSTDGLTWTFTDLSAGGYWRDICFGAGRFVIVSDNDAWDGAYPGEGIAGGEAPGTALGSMYSTDGGATWNAGSTTPVGARVVSNGTVFVASSAKFEYGNNGATGTYYIAANLGVKYSSDGVTWAAATMPAGFTTYYVPYLFWDGVEFVAVNTQGDVARSSDGVTWTLQYAYLGTGSAKNLSDAGRIFIDREYVLSFGLGATIASHDSVVYVYRRSMTTSPWANLGNPGTGGTYANNAAASVAATRHAIAYNGWWNTTDPGYAVSASTVGGMYLASTFFGPSQIVWVDPLVAPPTVTLPALTLEAGVFATGRAEIEMPLLYAIPAPIAPTFWAAKVGAREA